MTVRVDGQNLTIEDVVRVARLGDEVELTAAALERIRTCRGMLERKVANHEIMYGVNTGIGEFSEVVLDDEQVRQFQRFLIYNHAAGIAVFAGSIQDRAFKRDCLAPGYSYFFLPFLGNGTNQALA